MREALTLLGVLLLAAWVGSRSSRRRRRAWFPGG
jgi:hypothetical protein